MDHYGLLTLARTVTTNLRQIESKRVGDNTWKWTVTPVIFPESHCPYCSGVIRSPYIWFLEGTKYENFVGILNPNDINKKVVLGYASHPHGGRPACLGKNPDGIALLASTVNINDSGMPRALVPKWLKVHWNHDCRAMREWLAIAGLTNSLLELDRP